VSDNAAHLAAAHFVLPEEAPMKRLQLTPAAGQRAASPAPAPRLPVIIATDLARMTWKHAVHWGNAVQRTLSTPGTREHLQALVRTYHPAHPVLVVYEACGFGYEIAWWAQAVGVAVLVVAPLGLPSSM
jgi:hypothetical protein